MKAFFIQMASAWSLWLLAAALVFAGLQTARLEHSQNKAAGYEARVASRDAERERVHAADQALARQKESDLAAVAETTRKAANDAIQTSNLRIAALTDSLRNRPSRVATGGSGTTPPANPATGSTGAGLYREDGVFLAGEAAAAARISIERDQCIQLYEQARNTLITYSQEISK